MTAAVTVVILSNIPAEALIDERHVLDRDTFVEIVIWRLPRPSHGSQHRFKYRLALVRNGICVMRYDNEAGKGDHRHVDGKEEPYVFKSADTLLEDFWREADIWRALR